MARCAVCHQEIKIIKTQKEKVKRHHRTHSYCRWRLHNFLTQDLWSVFAFFILSFICFLFLILAGAIGKDVILRNTAYIVLAWTILFTLWLLGLNYLKLVHECCRHQGTTYRFWKHRHRTEDEIVTKKDVLE